MKTLNGLAIASVKTINGLAIASVKTWNGITVPHGFSPSSISNMLMGFEANDLSLSDGDPVETWADKSGNGYNLTSSGTNRPLFKIISGEKMILFDGATDAGHDYLNNTTNPSNQGRPVTVFIRLKLLQGDTSACAPVCTTSGDGGGYGMSIYYYPDVSSGWYIYDGTFGSASQAKEGTNFIVMTAVWKSGPATSYLRRNGVQISSGVLGTYNMTGFHLGGRYSGGTNDQFNGYITHVYVYGKEVTGTELTDMESYLTI